MKIANHVYPNSTTVFYHVILFPKVAWLIFPHALLRQKACLSVDGNKLRVKYLPSHSLDYSYLHVNIFVTDHLSGGRKLNYMRARTAADNSQYYQLRNGTYVFE